ncbi:AraC family transcriptional regulator [Paucilactobacillus suebicus]|uniref:AraC family transcriptional regulator n=1 Tax=Paucilactobacillus suebicus DSM 5007 = KCTC 3549 TaxID=1423807 RepID=A0A0R1W430_9LACO|nr:AraC family transcriptional regulator [Paucilactobacillus suebicus]KRM12608.1 AraC family transcriptional regulator [Paucilactobacillus suebicus DSM 5007 = KCTC 3549]
MISILDYKSLAISLNTISGVPVRLCSLHLEPLYESPDAKQTVPGFHTLPLDPGDCCRAQDGSGIYLAVGIWHEDLLGYLIAGPYQQLSDALPRIMINLGKTGPVEIHLHDQQAYIPQIDTSDEMTEEEAGEASQVLSIYVAQNQLMDAIANGDQSQLTQIVNSTIQNMHPFLNRIPSRELRAAKNIIFVYNTLCRLAAERGSASKLLIDKLSSKYALQIEKLASIDEAIKLINEMPFRYCDLVIAKRNKQYNMRVAAAIEYIMLNFQEELQLTDIAQAVHTSPTYLSHRFKKDTGETLFSFINHYRIKVAQAKLRDGDFTISEIAISSGFNNVTYFNRIFKKYTGTSPRKYARLN